MKMTLRLYGAIDVAAAATAAANAIVAAAAVVWLVLLSPFTKDVLMLC